MRTLTLSSVLTLTLLGVASPAMAQSADDPAVTEEEVERKREEVREMERKLREQERAEDAAYERRKRRREDARLWFGVGTGIGYGSVEVTCSGSGFGAECTEEGLVNTFVGNVTASSARGLTARLRGLRDTDKGGDARTPYELAALLGTRFGRSSWYGMAGYGRVYHADDDFTRNHSGGIAWEIFFAPETEGPVGLELGFQGNNGHYVDYVAFNVGMRFGALR
jgi:hypothetical protein